MKMKYFSDTRVAGFQYHEGLLCYDELKVGSVLTMRRDANNSYDHNAVALYCGENLVGYLPRTENKVFALLLDLGWDELFEVRINKVNYDAHPEHQIGITIFAKEKERRE